MIANASEPLTLEEVLRAYGPHWNGGLPTDDEVFSRLDAFGHAVWRLESRTQREYAIQIWTGWISEKLCPCPAYPWRIVREAVAAGATTTGITSWRWYADTELAELPPITDLVRGHIPYGGLVLFYGPSGHGKTHVALDLAQCLGTGLPWLGHMVTQGLVAYIMAEGIGGLARRVEAWKRRHDWDDPTGVRFLAQPVHLLEATEAARLAADLETWDPRPRLVVLDTLAWCIAPGDENATKDMTAFVASVGDLRARIGATILIVHHTGHDKSRERGNTALAAACDTVVKVQETDGVVTVACDKQRESVPFAPLQLRLVPVAESVVPELMATDEAPDELMGSDRQALQALQDIAVPGEGVPTGRWDEATGLSRSTFYRCRKKLIGMGLIYVEKKRNFPGDSLGESHSPTEVPF